MTTTVNAFTTRIAPISFARHEQARVARIVKQPPQFGIGQHAAAPKDASALAAVRALQGAQFERTEHRALGSLRRPLHRGTPKKIPAGARNTAGTFLN